MMCMKPHLVVETDELFRVIEPPSTPLSVPADQSRGSAMPKFVDLNVLEIHSTSLTSVFSYVAG